jgi:adenylate cyclase
MSYDLFANEEKVLAGAHAFAGSDGFSGEEERRAFMNLLTNYEKLMKITRRLMRLSDRNERELSELAEKQRVAAEQVLLKNRELEVLSSKLAKYLSPQVYGSIFAGTQEVKLESQRKKLTVFFSDIAGFTETTDKMESEDLTQLLNRYLTEMSQVALDHGATIDKYIGDAIMIFFGDPETRGVREDALACVRMAIAMQKRMVDLADTWCSSGMETPMRCRIGIHTGYCTVGNFGNEDRMDYTIIGGAVNLASRLEREAPPGGILVSYDTHALVKDEIYCEEQGRVRVKGIAYPVAAFKVIGARDELAVTGEILREELPHLKLDAMPERMSEDERAAATIALRRVLARLESA